MSNTIRRQMPSDAAARHLVSTVKTAAILNKVNIDSLSIRSVRDDTVSYVEFQMDCEFDPAICHLLILAESVCSTDEPYRVKKVA